MPGKAEKRADPNETTGKKYTKQAFIDLYGKKNGMRFWDAAGGKASPGKGSKDKKKEKSFHGENMAEFFGALQACLPGVDGKIQCLNMYKYNQEPKYPEGFSGEREKTGRAAWERYARGVHDMCVAKSGGKMLYYGAPGPNMCFMGPKGVNKPPGDVNGWDAIALMEYDSSAVMLAMMTSEDYAAVAPHRVAGVAWQTWSLWQRPASGPLASV